MTDTASLEGKDDDSEDALEDDENNEQEDDEDLEQEDEGEENSEDADEDVEDALDWNPFCMIFAPGSRDLWQGGTNLEPGAHPRALREFAPGSRKMGQEQSNLALSANVICTQPPVMWFLVQQTF